MSSPVLATKLFVPARRPRLVPRPRLAARLDGSLEGGHRLTLVSAPAGFGKSSLLADWAAQLARREPPVRVGWMSLGDEDDDLAAFLALLAASLAGLDIQVDGSALGRHRDATAAASAVVRADALRPGAVRVLVMDDVHLVRAPEVHQAVAFLVDHLPAGLHLVLSTRSDPPLALARLRARGELIELRAADLRFTRAEAEDFLVAAMGLTLDAHDVDALEGRTEGWIAALQLVSLALGGRSGGGQAHDFVRDFAGSHRFVLDYLTDEVLDRQPAPVREFLLRTAVLDRLCGPACDALTGRTDGTAMLERVWADNLFLVSLDDDRSWYRYHHLFADVLRARLSAQDPDLVADLHRLASRWFAANGYLVEAVGQALAGSDDERAAYLVEDAVPLLRRSRQDSLLLGWIRALPRARVRVSPVLSLVCAWSLMLEGDLDGADARLDDADAALAAGRADTTLAAGWAPTGDRRRQRLHPARERSQAGRGSPDLGPHPAGGTPGGGPGPRPGRRAVPRVRPAQGHLRTRRLPRQLGCPRRAGRRRARHQPGLQRAPAWRRRVAARGPARPCPRGGVRRVPPRHDGLRRFVAAVP
ncbi:hypothetical protein [Arsenicicoccus bolidensis]|uniref:hypothetical protein n=1 Tax=Arsenicicoccus bolidensis TaxID=229480 RepID=UPI0028A717E8|nr:hypothetical protein [Arsenicicoccus bolidensis]